MLKFNYALKLISFLNMFSLSRTNLLVRAVTSSRLYLMFLFILIVLTIAFCSYLSRIKYKRNAVNEFPEPPGHFLFGHILEVSSTTNILKTCTKFTNTYGKTIKVKFGPIKSVLVTCDYDFLEFLLTYTGNSLTKSENYQFLKDWLGSGLLLSEGLKWKRNRKILTPAFHFEILKQFVVVFESVGDDLMNKMSKYDGSSSLDLYPLLTLCTLDAICETAMGTTINAQQGENSQYVQCVKEIGRIVIDRCLSLLKYYDLTFALTSDYYLQRRLLKILHGFTLSVIAGKKKELKKTNNDTNTKKKLALLDLLLKFRSDDGRMLSDDEIRHEVDTFMFEGHDTTAAGISFILFCLANHPDVQEKVLKEQINMFGVKKDPEVAYQDLQNMKYLEHVIKETLRLYPPVPFIGRFATENIKFNSHVIGKNTNIVLFIYGLLRNPDFFPEPEKFNPDRFSSLNASTSFAYIPFSAGQRNCIGQKFAMLEMKSVVSKVVRHFELKPAIPNHELILSAEAVLKSTNGIKIGLMKRC